MRHIFFFAFILLINPLCFADDFANLAKQKEEKINKINKGKYDGANISNKQIEKIISELKALKNSKSSSTSRRRGYKNLVRSCQKLVKENTDAANLYSVLFITLKAQYALLQLDNSDKTRGALLELCGQIANSPIEFAEIRFEAELMLLNFNLDKKNAKADERSKALFNLIEMYQYTTRKAQLKSLFTGIKLTQLSGDMILRDYLIKKLSERFPGNKQAILFRRNLFSQARLDVVFSGEFKTSKGESISFPIDRFGHPYVVVFWSKNSKNVEEYLLQLKKEQTRNPDLFEVFSINCDELPDSGVSILEKIGLKCTAMQLPGGVHSETYRAYALKSPMHIYVNEYGYSILYSGALEVENPNKNIKRVKKGEATPTDLFRYPEPVASQHRFKMHLQSLLNGDFLVSQQLDFSHKSTESKGVPVSSLNELVAIFEQAPMRYRLKVDEAIAQYKRAEQMCSKLISEHSDDDDLYRVRNIRVLSLLGLWRSKGDHDFLMDAIKEAEKVISTYPSKNSIHTVAQYCLAINKMRFEMNDPNKVLRDFMETLQNNKDPYVCATASMLALQANLNTEFEAYRNQYLQSKNKTNSVQLHLYDAFINSRYHDLYRSAGDISYWQVSRKARYQERHYIWANEINPSRKEFPSIELTMLNGDTLNLPQKESNKLTILMFAEAPSDGGLNISSKIYKLAKPDSKNKEEREPDGMVAVASSLAAAHIHSEVDVVLAFLSDEMEYIKKLHQKYKFPCDVALVPGGLKNPIINEMNIVGSDQYANTFLIKRNGLVTWSIGGLAYRAERGSTFIARLGIDLHIFKSDIEAGCEALLQQNYKKAKHLFSGPNVLKLAAPAGKRTKNLLRHKWSSSVFYGRALAALGMKDWDAALKAIENSIHEHTYNFRHDINKPCESMIHLQKTRIKILEALGRNSEARVFKNLIAAGPTEYKKFVSDVIGDDTPYDKMIHKLGEIEIK